MVTADRVAYHDIAIVTVAKDYAFVQNNQHLTCFKMSLSYSLRSNVNVLLTVVCTDIGIVTDTLKALVSSSTLYSNKLQTFPEATTIACKTWACCMVLQQHNFSIALKSPHISGVYSRLRIISVFDFSSITQVTLQLTKHSIIYIWMSAVN